MDLNIYFLSQANFSIIVKNGNALVYDCGTSKPSEWIENGNFKYNYERYLINIFKEVKTILIIVSHKDDNHMNLYIALKNLFNKNNKKSYFINNNNENLMENFLECHSNFFNTYSESYPKFVIKSFISFNKKNKNENSIILKIKVNFKNNETYSILFTGDANENTLNTIIEKYYDVKKYDVSIKEIFSDVLCHYSTNKDKSNIWNKYVITKSKYPSLNIISSNLFLDSKPSLEMIENFVNCYKKKPLNENEYYKNFYCLPHYIKCNLNSEIIEYTSFNNGFVLPIFITNDSYSNGYKIKSNSNGITLNDDIDIYNYKKINIPLYEFNLLKVFNDKRKINEIYSFYLAFQNQMNNEFKYNTLSCESIEKENINYNNLYEKKKRIIKYFQNLEKYYRFKKINNDICNDTKLEIEYLKVSIEEFINMAFDLKHSLNVKEFLYNIFEKDDKMKSKIDEIINKVYENNSVIKNQRKKRKI